jgi:predicted negative regulator of RcsB-dependent stress response
VLWLPLAFCLVAVVGSLGYAGMRGWRLWKTARATAKATSHAVGRVITSATAAEKRAASLTAGTARLSIAITHLQSSLEELAVIRSAAAEPRNLLTSIRGLVPRK